MSSTGDPALPQAAPESMALMNRAKRDLAANSDGFLSQSFAFARRIADTGTEFDEAAHAALVLEEARRCCDPADGARQLAAMAKRVGHRSALTPCRRPVGSCT